MLPSFLLEHRVIDPTFVLLGVVICLCRLGYLRMVAVAAVDLPIIVPILEANDRGLHPNSI
jgi:hypothetical protein